MTEALLSVRGLRSGYGAVEVLRGEPGLVGLEVADQLPPDGGGGGGAFRNALLHAVFSDSGQAVACGVLGRGGGMRFRDGEQRDLGRVSANFRAGFRNFGADTIGALGKLGVGDQRG